MSDDTFRSAEEAVQSLFGTNPQPQQAEDNREEEELEVSEVGEEAKSDTGYPEEDLETGEDADEYDQEDEEPYFTVNIGGTEQQVTLSELQNGYQRQRDYTRKTEELAKQRREVEEAQSGLSSELEQYRTARESYIELVNQLSNALENEGLEDPPAELYEQDPVAYLRIKDEVRSRREKQAALKEEQRKLNEEKTQEQQKQLNEILKRERQKMLDAIPDWKDEKTFASEMAEIRDYAKSVGYSDYEIANAIDSRTVLAIRKAMLYDYHLNRGQQKIKKSPKVLKGPGYGTGSRSKSAVKKAREKFSKDSSIDNAVDMILAQRRG